MPHSPLFAQAIERFDALHSEDPVHEESEGQTHPRELLYAQRMSRRLATFAPDASEALALAVHAQHLRRWTLERSAYPEGRKGYRQWRTDQSAAHAQLAAEILQELGYPQPLLDEVQSLIRKEQLKLNPQAQRLEDIACLVFLEHYLEPFVAKHQYDDEKLHSIVRKTWKKMSPEGHAAAASLALPAHVADMIKAALDG